MKLTETLSQIRSPIILGFFISLVGTLPLGYINIIGLNIYLDKGFAAVIWFILGVVFIEYFVLRLVHKGAKWLVMQKKILVLIDLFTILFLLLMAFAFFLNKENKGNSGLSHFQLAQFPFLLGVLLNSMNFMQWPYWSGIYIYLFQNNKLKTNTSQNQYFILGALSGTFVGILTFALLSSYLFLKNGSNLGKYLNAIFVLLFLILAFIQIIKFYIKTKKNRKSLY